MATHPVDDDPRATAADWRAARAPAWAVERRPRATGGLKRLADALGLFSLAIGVAASATPRRIARLIGLDESRDTRDMVRAIGLRELASGVGILAEPAPAGWMLARVGGDIMDLTLLGSSFGRPGVDSGRLRAATGAVAAVTALDLVCTRQLAARPPEALTDRGPEPAGDPGL